MYYWYKINTVTITFPHYVGYALYYDGRESNTASGVAVDGGLSVSGATAQGSGLYNVGSNSARDNIIPPLDLGSWFIFLSLKVLFVIQILSLTPNS